MQSMAENLQSYRFGQAINDHQFKAWDIDIAPDGKGLPAGSATADEGEETYLQRCASCHGEFGEGMGRFPVLIGTTSDLDGERPRKTVGGYWPYSTTLWDYINRAMPFGYAQSLSTKQVYAVTAYILSMNDIIDSDEVMNAQTLPQVIMPNKDGFLTSTQSDMHITACMQDCKTDVIIKSRSSESPINAKGE